MFLEIEKDNVYINRESISHFFYDPEEDAFRVCMINGGSLLISNEVAENLLNYIQPIIDLTGIKKKDSAD
jgi:hypothetical protein